MTFETFDQRDEKTSLPTYKPTHLPTYLPTYLTTYLPTYVPPLDNTLKGAIIETCDIWDTDYNTDNWEPGFMTFFVTWQLIVALDSIRNSCDVLLDMWDVDKNSQKNPVIL